MYRLILLGENSMFDKAKALVVATAISVSLIIPSLATKANAWQSYEHVWNDAVLPQDLTQSGKQNDANIWCQNQVNSQKWYGGIFYDQHGGAIQIFNWDFPYVWAHQSLRKCVINKTNPVRYGGHP